MNCCEARMCAKGGSAELERARNSQNKKEEGVKKIEEGVKKISVAQAGRIVDIKHMSYSTSKDRVAHAMLDRADVCEDINHHGRAQLIRCKVLEMYYPNYDVVELREAIEGCVIAQKLCDKHEPSSAHYDRYHDAIVLARMSLLNSFKELVEVGKSCITYCVRDRLRK